ncbi:hypothetical protein ACEN2I_17630 [Flavobacterium sp. W22_SRS_FK3]|uniref:tetratricopeptide repeat protein n=1 Tax=Flavobacterium sp. W22_SRS_FK3 TaxID=3240275 RepID=UPI003F912133
MIITIRIDSAYSSKILQINLYDTIKEIDEMNADSYFLVERNPFKSVELAIKALEISRKFNYKIGEAMAYKNLGYSDYKKKDYVQAITYYLLSIRSFHYLKDDKQVASLKVKLGNCFVKIKEFKNAKKYYNEAFDFFLKNNLTTGLIDVNLKQAELFIEENKLEEASNKINSALKLGNELKQEKKADEINKVFSKFYLKKNKKEKALDFIDQSISIASENNLIAHTINSLLIKAEILMESKDFIKSEETLRNALNLAKKNEFKFDIVEIYNLLWKLKILLNKPSLALTFYNRYKEFIDSNFENMKYSNSNSFEGLQSEEPRITLFNNLSLLLNILLLIFLLLTTFLFKGKANRVSESSVVNKDVIDYKVSLPENDLTPKNSHNKNLLKQIESKEQEVASYQFTISQKDRLIATLEEKYMEKEKKLIKELEFKNKQLTSFKFCYDNKNEIIEQILNKLEKVKKVPSSEKNEILSQLNKSIKKNLAADKNWEYFREFFQESQVGFHSKLMSKHKDLRPNDLKICSLIRLNLTIKEMADILAISPGSLKTARYRLRKKMNLDSEQNILDYLISIES